MQTKEAKQFASKGPEKRLVSVSQETSAKHALRLMREARIHHLLVLKDGECRGIVSARDLVPEVEAGEWYGSVHEVTVGEVMHPQVPLIDEKTDIKTALKAMLDSGLTALPLVRDGKVTGIITETDLLRLLERLLDHAVSFRDLVNRGEATVAHPLVQNLMKALGDAGI